MFITLHEVTQTGELVKNRVRAEIITRLVPLALQWSKNDTRRYHPETRVFTHGHGSTSIEVLESIDEVEKLCLQASSSVFGSEGVSAEEKKELEAPFDPEAYRVVWGNMLGQEVPTPLELQPAPSVGRLSTSE